ncbi:methyltransferase domain-containing protein [Herbidospora yilanensis]|uniref:methyltransferase domain-containing protein n=1 Tax=Herbidospora yilanensis TaxID=354426 RepID=UPI0007C76798|nr:methyltransferase domain-containing protein [Herbidospora yilanensis]
MSNSWTSASGADLSAGYARHAGTLRGALRHALVARALRTHLPSDSQQVLDIGGGDGHQAVLLARAGHRVTLLDPDQGMHKRAADRISGESEQVRDRITLVEGTADQAGHLAENGFDLVCCHGVLMYAENPHAFLNDLASAVRPGGLVSLLTKNADGLAMRPALEGRWADAVAVLGAGSVEGNLGVSSRADALSAVEAILGEAGVTTCQWYGVRVFTDHLGDAPVGEGFDYVLEAEWQAGCRDPYRQIARLFHLIGQKR